MKSYKNIDEYIDNFPLEVQDRLKWIRKEIEAMVPEIKEKISYGIPTTTRNGKPFIYFAGYKNHVSLYPVTPAMETCVKEINEYRTGSGTLQFSNKKPLPTTVIKNIIEIRARESQES